MITSELKNLLTPFKPCRIRLSDGTVLTIPHEDYIFFVPNQQYVAIAVDGFHVVASEHIAVVEFELENTKH